MAAVKCLQVFLALAIVASARVQAKKNPLSEICYDLGMMVEIADLPSDDAEKVFNYGKNYLSQLRGLSKQTKIERDSLIGAWDNVIHGAKCSASSFDEVAVIARCMPWSESLQTLNVATKKYLEDCLKAEYVGEKIVSVGGGSKSSSLNVRKFIDSKFITTYRGANPNERPILLNTVGGPKCCEPERATSAIANAIGSNLEKSKEVKEKFAGNQKKLSNYLEKNLFTPCKGYKRALNDLIYDLWLMGHFAKGGPDGLIVSMSPEVQDDVFRYNLCDNMQHEANQKKVVQLVLDQF